MDKLTLPETAETLARMIETEILRNKLPTSVESDIDTSLGRLKIKVIVSIYSG